MKFFLMFIINFSCFFLKVVSLGLTVQPRTFFDRPSLLIWVRQPVDGNQELNFDLRFVQGTDERDAGLAVTAIHASPTQQFGTAKVVFPTQGTYEVIAVNRNGLNTNIGTSNDVDAIAPRSLSATPTSKLTYASSRSSGTSSISALVRPHSKTPIIIGSILISVILLAIIATLVMFFVLRRRKEIKRWSFHGERMVQDRRTPSPISQISPRSSFSDTLVRDLEQGLNAPPPDFPSTQLPPEDSEPRLPDPVVYPVTRVPGPRGRRPLLRMLELEPSSHNPLPRVPVGPRSPLVPPSSRTPRSTLPRSARAMTPGPRSPMPRSPSPRTHRQRAIGDQIEILRIQMLQCERNSEKDGVPSMFEMAEKMAWLREQQEGAWALGLTEVTPLGYDRYMT